MQPRTTIPNFDAFLAQLGLTLDAVVTGGTALALLGIISRGLDLGDCLALLPSPLELAQAEIWIATQDLNPDWPAHVRASMDDLAWRLGHGL